MTTPAIPKGLGAVLAGLLVTGVATVPAAHAAPNANTPFPVFTGSATPVPDQRTGYHARNQLQAIFDADLANGAGGSSDQDFWIDRMLARTGNQPGGSNGDGNQYLFSRGRAVFMKTHQPGTLGFGGEVAYIDSIAGGQGAYTITASIGGADVTLTEDAAQRKQTPSYWRGVFASAAAGLRVVQTKFITDANVAVTNLEVSSTDGAAKSVSLTASSPFARTAADDDGELTGAVWAHNKLTSLFPRFSGDGFTPVEGTLRQTVAVPATGSAGTKLQLGFVAKENAASAAEYERFRGLAPGAAFTEQVTAYNRWWARNVPYLDTPEDNIDKTLFYRWWLMRFNFLDADIPGNDYQFPTSMEGVLGYNNAIVLTIGMFVDDLKYFRDPVYSYGPWVSAGEVAKSSKYVDNPGDPANWSNSYTQYISEAAWRSYQLHGGPKAIAANLAEYAENDVKGLQEAYDFDGNGLIEYNWGAMTGNDADAVSFDWRKNEYMDRTENAYLYSNALAASKAYRIAGNDGKADEMAAFAEEIKAAVLEYLWEPARTTPDEMGHLGNLLKHRHVASNTLVPWKEINNYYPFSVGLMPNTAEHREALRLFADDAQYPIFPFATANQADKAAAAAQGDPGSNNFSVINSTVTFRMLSSVLRNYPTSYLDAEWYKKLLYWNAWSHYQNNGDNRYPDQNEFWADGSAANQSIGYRSWIHHTILGATNFTVIEDAMGLRPRDDAKVELDPIDIGWDHFTANNIRYRDRDLTVVWDAPGGARHYGEDVPEGYSVYLDGQLAFTADRLAKLVYDPATGQVTAPVGVQITNSRGMSVKAPQEVSFSAGARIVDVMAKAGADVAPASAGAADVAAGRPVTASFSASGRGPAGAVDGATINEPFWGTAGSPGSSDSLVIDLEGARRIDDVRVYFYDTSTTATVQGYAPPAQFLVEYDDGDGWARVPGQSRFPAYPRGNLNRVRFDPVEAERLRITVWHTPGSKTGIKEVQAFHTGVAAPDPVNAPPLADAWLDSSYNQAGSVRLIGLAQDDGDPGTPLTSAWSVVDAPEGGAVAFDPANLPTTIARFTRSGRYTLRLTVGGATKDVLVNATALTEGEINVAATASASASFTAGWNNVNAVNDGKPAFFAGGAQTDLWGTWTGNEPATRWLQYDFPSAVRVDRASIDFWSDSTTGGSGVAVPRSWKVQFWDGAAWQDVTGATGFDPAVRGRTNEVSFDPVTTTRLRATFNALPNAAGTAYSAVGVSEWRVYAAAASSIAPVDVRTQVGVLPTLPSTVEVTYADGARLPVAVAWGTVDPNQVDSVGDFTVSGFVAGTTLTANAHVWVRGGDPVQINTIDPVAVTTAVGVAPVLPAGVTVGYNDGSRQSGIPVTWDPIDPAKYAAEGTFEVSGQVGGTDKAATATVTVGGGGPQDTAPPVTTLTADPADPWTTSNVTVTAAATDNRDRSPDIQINRAGAWADYTAPITITDEGETTIRARATDDAGNVSVITELTVGIDRTAPTANATFDKPERTVTVNGADALSGIASVQYKLPDGDWTTANGPVPIGSAATTVQYRSVDRAGNASAVGSLDIEAGQAPVNVARTAAASASYTPGWVTADNIADGVTPTGPAGPNTDVWNTWPQVGEQWIQLDWTAPVTVDRTRIWFTRDLDDAGNGVAPPSSWKLQHWDGTAWKDVVNPSAYGTSATEWNTVTFEKVTTTRLRALLTASGAEEGKGAPGVQEWEVYDVPAPGVEVQARSQCIAGKAYVAGTAKNVSQQALTIELVTPYGSRTVTGVAPGRSAYQAFNSRAAQIAAGEATVEVNGGSLTAPYAAASCG